MIKKVKTWNENLHLAEVQLTNIIMKHEVIYKNIETNNNIDILNKKIEALDKDAEKGKLKETKKKVNTSNYKEYLNNFLKNFKELPNDDLKSKEAAMKRLEKGHNIFHFSLLDIGL